MPTPPSPSQTPIHELSATQLAAAIARGQLTAVQAVEAYIARIEAVNPRLNALVIPFFDEARAAARQADEAVQQGQVLGPLHGVPVTVKETFDVQGMPTTFGLTTLQNGRYRAAEDARLVHNLRQAGAILLGKTNIPQMAFYLEADNPVYGRTNNPWNLDRSPMGSTGGEAALIAAGGSALGLGSDLAGSARVPAFACGIHSLKTTSSRLSSRGHPNSLPGQEALLIDFGTMARHVEDLVLSLKALSAPDDPDQDSSLPPVPLRDPAGVAIEDLTVGVYTDNGLITAAPAIRRVAEAAAEALRQQGAQVVPFQPPDVREAVQIYQGAVTASGYQAIHQFMQGSRRDWRMDSQLLSVRLPRVVRWPVVRLLRLLGQSQLAFNLEIVGTRSTTAYWEITERRTAYRQRFLEAMNAQNIDVVLCPPYAVPAFKHGDGYGPLWRPFHHVLNVTLAASYAVLFNVLGMPAGVVAAGRVQPGEESDRPTSRDMVLRVARDIEQDSAGLPVGVQVAGRHWREDVVLAVMAALEAHFRQQPDYPHAPPL